VKPFATANATNHGEFDLNRNWPSVLVQPRRIYCQELNFQGNFLPIQQIDRESRASMLQARWKQALRIHHNPPSFNGVRYGGAPAIVKWIENTLLVGIPLVGSAFAIQHIARHGLTKIDVLSFFLFYLLVGLGVALGLHRYFSHKSFETTPTLAFLLGAFGSMAFQGSIFRWVIDHRRHHSHTDEFGDVHSPYVDPWGEEHGGLSGFLYAHVGWLFDSSTTDAHVYGAGLPQDRLVMFFTRTHWLWPAASLALPYGFGYLLGGPDAALGSMLVGGCLRTTILHNVIWSVNSIGHRFGQESFRQGNGSKNNLTIALLTFGDGWHNNHHCFPRSAFHGLTKSEIDVNGWLITGLERLGLAWNVVRIPENRILDARHSRTSPFEHA
jgi:stearoyl-CoA desaturase (Delta-9 desaturase)